MIEEQNVKAKKLDFKEILPVSIDKVYEVGFVFFTIKIIWFWEIFKAFTRSLEVTRGFLLGNTSLRVLLTGLAAWGALSFPSGRLWHLVTTTCYCKDLFCCFKNQLFRFFKRDFPLSFTLPKLFFFCTFWKKQIENCLIVPLVNVFFNRKTFIRNSQKI